MIDHWFLTKNMDELKDVIVASLLPTILFFDLVILPIILFDILWRTKKN